MFKKALFVEAGALSTVILWCIMLLFGIWRQLFFCEVQ